MDSLTQIVLGASVGEVVLGKKIGNRAMIWGAIAGTIPDLDIIGNLFMTEIEALAFHRGISHSIFFGVTFSFLIAFLVNRWYGRYENDAKRVHLNVGYKSWYIFFFWCIFTHPILDSFTSYGTQLFAPFSNYRVAFDNISVADPLYTLPFLICLVVAAFYNRSNPKRRFWNYLGLGVSSLYMLITLLNANIVNQRFETKLKERDIDYVRARVSPTILNNILWLGVAEGRDSFYINYHTLWNTKAYQKMDVVAKNHFLLEAKSDDKTINILKWFSNNYYSVIELENDTLQFNDMRFGTFSQDYKNGKDYVFHFIIHKNDKGKYDLIRANAGPPDTESRMNLLPLLWQSIKGDEK